MKLFRLYHALLWLLIAFSGTLCSPQYRQDAYTEQDKADVRHMVQVSEPGRPMLYNFADDAQYRFYKKQLHRSGINETTHPQLFRVLEETRKKHQQQAPPRFDAPRNESEEAAFPINIITSFDTKDQITYTSSALSSFPYKIYSSTISLGLFNQDGDSIGPSNSAEAYCDVRDLEVATKGTEPILAAVSDSTVTDTVHSFFSYFYHDAGGIHHGYFAATTANVVDSIINIDPMPCTLNDTVRGCNNDVCADTSVITVCMTRTTPACTYCNPGYADNFMFPMQGHIIYSGNVNVDTTTGKPNSGAFYNITVTRLPSGGGCDGIPLKGNFWDYVTVDGNKLSWNIDGAQFQNNCLQSGDSVIFQLTIFVKVGNKPAFATVTNAREADPPYFRIPPMQIVSGCLAEGTQVTLQNGQQRPIEAVEMLAQVKSGASTPPRCVKYNTIGRERKPMIRIKDDKGHELLVTEDHPVVLINTIKPAKDLKVQDKIQTDKGPAAILSLNREKYDGEVWNLALDRCNSSETAPDHTNATFYANGILVGDSKMQVYYKYYDARVSDTCHLPAEWKQDYENYLKKQGKAGK